MTTPPLAVKEGWKPMVDAPRDGRAILLKFRLAFAPEREDLDHWRHVEVFVGRHPGVCKDGFDIGWGFAAPVGQGGFPDEWFDGWDWLPDDKPATFTNTGGPTEGEIEAVLWRTLPMQPKGVNPRYAAGIKETTRALHNLFKAKEGDTP